MKTWTGLWEEYCTEDNTAAAYSKAKKHKSKNLYVVEFEKDRDKNLQDVHAYATSGRYHTSDYESEIIKEPKERIIYKLPFAPDRITHHKVLLVLIPYFERYFIDDSYACVNNKGQIKASQRTMVAVRRNKYCLECDIHHAYPSVNQSRLSEMYHRKIRDEKFMNVVDDIIFSFPGKSKVILLPDYNPGYNLPIGNVTSQWSFNFYMTKLDFFCKHVLKVKDYIRFSDNFNLYSNDKSYLHYCRERIGEFLDKELGLTFSKSNVFSTKQGVDFVGYRHFDNYILVRKSTAKRMKKKIAELPELYERGEITLDEFRAKIDSVAGWISHANAHNLAISLNLRAMRKKYIENADNK